LERANIIKRAFDIAAECGSIEQVQRRLRDEDYLSVSGHLSGRHTRSEIARRLNPALVAEHRRKRKGGAQNRIDAPA
jgi:hypothetical protein